MATPEEIRRAKLQANPNYGVSLDINKTFLPFKGLPKSKKVKMAKNQPDIKLAQESLGGNFFGTKDKDMVDFYARHPWAKKYDLSKKEDVLAMQEEYNAMLAKQGLPPYFTGTGVTAKDGLVGDHTYSMPALEDIPQAPTPELKPQSKLPDILPILGNTALGIYGLNLANTKMPKRPNQPVFDRDNVLNTELAKSQVRSEMMSPQMLREMERAAAGRMQAGINNAAAASGGQAGSFASNVQQTALGNAGQRLQDLVAAEKMRMANQQLMQGLMGQRNEETGRLQNQAFIRSGQDLQDYRDAVKQANTERQFGRQMAINNFSGALQNINPLIEGFGKYRAAKRLGRDIEMKNQIAKDRFLQEQVDKDANAIEAELTGMGSYPLPVFNKPKPSINPILQAMQVAEDEASKKRGIARRQFLQSPLNRKR